MIRLRRSGGLENTKPRWGSGALQIRRLVWELGARRRGVANDLIGTIGSQLYGGVPHRNRALLTDGVAKMH
jgi:hypothetical protein